MFAFVLLLLSIVPL